MSRIDFYYFLLLGILCLAIFGVPKLPHERYQQPHPIKDMPAQQLASHFLIFQTMEGENVTSCTGTAIGPHAFMTATHCVRGKNAAKVLIDLTMDAHLLLSTVSDGRDHTIFLINGQAFQNYISVVPVDAKMDSVLVTYGTGKGAYPPIPKYGRVMSCEDPSDLDRIEHEFCTTLPVVSGDSGAAIYDDKGEVVGLVTFAIDNEITYTNTNFALNFARNQLDFAATFGIGGETPIPRHQK